MGTLLYRALTSLALIVVCSLSAQETSLGQRRKELPARKDTGALSGHDRADLRRDFNLWWFGGRPSPDYLDYKNQMAAMEMARWSHLMPGSGKTLPLLTGTSSAMAGVGTWVNLGPYGNLTSATFPDIDSGRPVAMLAHPANSTLYLATSGGGVFRCDNADPAATGDWTWTPITDSLPLSGSGGNVSLGAMAMSPSNSATLYLGAGDAHDSVGRGFFKSTDGGANWTAATSIGAATRSYAILPLNESRIFWGTDDGLKVSNDGGATFTTVSTGPTTGTAWSVQKLTATDLICSIENSNVGAVYFSSNSGTTWQPVTLPVTGAVRITLATSSASATTVWGIYENASGNVARGLLKSTDKGATWTWVAAPTSTGGLFQGTGPGTSMSTDGGQGFYNHGLAVDPSDANRVFVGANLALYRTTDGGANWSQMTHWYGYGHVYTHADFHAVAWSADKNTLYFGNDGGLAVVRDPFRATIPSGSVNAPLNSDVTFIDNRRNKGLATHLVYALGSTTASTPADSRYRITLGLQDNGTRVRQAATAGGTLTGTEGIFEDQNGGDGFGTLIHPTNGNLMLGTLYYSRVYKSTDGGATQFQLSSTGIAEANNKTSGVFSTFLTTGNTADTVYTFAYTKVYKSTDYASSWTALGTTGLSGLTDTAGIRRVGASPSDPNAVGIVATGGRVFLTYNSGTTWAQAAAVPNNGFSMSCIAYDPLDSQIVYVSSVAPTAANNHLWKSTNGGLSWTIIDGNGLPSGIAVHVVKVDPSNTNRLYVGTDFGTYQSINGGSTWARFGNNLPMVAVRDLYLAPDGSFLRAATFGRGVWELQTGAGSVTVALDKTTATVAPSATTTFTATVTNFATDNKANWTVSASGGTVNPVQTASGVATTYTAPATPGIYTVTAASNESATATASATVNVYNPIAVAVTVTPSTKTLVTGTAFTFAASVANAPSQAVNWSASGGTIVATGVYSPPATAGTYTITATSIWPGTTPGTATVTVKTRDLNGDGALDLRDLLFFAKYYGTPNAVCDLSGDGTVDDADLALLLAGL